MSTNKYITSDGAGPMDSQSYVQSDWECASGHSKLQHNGESTLSVGSCWPYPAGREAVPRVAPPLGGRLGVQHRAVQLESTHTMTLQYRFLSLYLAASRCIACVSDVSDVSR